MYNIKNFVFYSIFGFIFEKLIFLIFNFNSNSGYLHGPYTIIYGIGLTLIFLLYDKFKKIKPVLKKLTISFICGFIVLTLLEFIGGILLKNIYDIQMWNYKDLPLNIGEYLSIEISTLWTLGSLLIYHYIKPLTDKLFKKIPNIIFLSIFLIIIFDFILTTILKFI